MKDWQTILRELPDPCGALSALTESPKGASFYLYFLAYRTTRVQITSDVEETLKATANLTNFGVALLRSNPGVLPTLRMATCPPLAVDRLIGLAGVPSNLVKVKRHPALGAGQVTGNSRPLSVPAQVALVLSRASPACPVPMYLPGTERQEERTAVPIHPEPFKGDGR